MPTQSCFNSPSKIINLTLKLSPQQLISHVDTHKGGRVAVKKITPHAGSLYFQLQSAKKINIIGKPCSSLSLEVLLRMNLPPCPLWSHGGVKINSLDKANSFDNRPDSKYFRLPRPYGLCYYSILMSLPAPVCYVFI